MKLLLSAAACDPYGGSEGIYGWYVVSALAKKHQCFVLTGARHRSSLEKAATEGLIPASLHFRFIGEAKPWPSNRLQARIVSWLDFRRFAKATLSVAKEWNCEVGFDIAQQVTYTSWRVPSPLWKLGIPFIWGPISGTEIFPRSCYSSLSLQARLFETLRSLQTQLAIHSQAVRSCAKMAFRIPVPHQQAIEFLAELRGKQDGVELCHNFFFPESRMKALHCPRPAVTGTHPLRAFGAGNLEGRKGVAIALHAIALAKSKGVRVEYHVTSQGPELAHLQKLSAKLGLSDQVILGKRFDSADFADALSKFDVCLLPSLRDGAGLSIMEAMLAGCVPIVADWCGPAEFVTNDCGFKVPVTNPKDMAIRISEILCHLDGDRQKTRRIGEAARAQIRVSYSEQQFLESMEAIYAQA